MQAKNGSLKSARFSRRRWRASDDVEYPVSTRGYVLGQQSVDGIGAQVPAGFLPFAVVTQRAEHWPVELVIVDDAVELVSRLASAKRLSVVCGCAADTIWL